jgi:hypothetical protein
MYTVQEKMWRVQRFSGGFSLRGVCDLFEQTYPRRPKPSATIVIRTIQRYKNTGKYHVRSQGHSP